jgi:hypothetical protein
MEGRGKTQSQQINGARKAHPMPELKVKTKAKSFCSHFFAMNIFQSFAFCFCLFACVSLRAIAQEVPDKTHVSQLMPGVTMIASDTGNWGGDALGISHQNSTEYWTEKTLFVPASALDGVKEARLRAYMGLLDNSVNTPAIAPNGLSESFIISVNGHEHLVPDSDPSLPATVPTKWRWHDFSIPVSELKPGKNVILFHKAPSETNDDFLYIGIDNTVSHGHSRMSQDSGKTWSTQELNTIKGRGEYMVRLLLLKNSAQKSVTWRPGSSQFPEVIGYAGMETDGAKPFFNVEIDPDKIDANQTLKVGIETGGQTAPVVRWLDKNGKPFPATSSFEGGVLTTVFAPAREVPARLEIEAGADGKNPVRALSWEYSPPLDELPRRRINMAPLVAAPKGAPQKRAPKARLTRDGFVLENATQVATFETKPALRLVALQNEWLGKNVLAHPEATHLFLIESEGKRFGAEDWRVQNVRQVAPNSIQVLLSLPQPELTAEFTISIDAQMLRFGLDIKNTSPQAQTWKTAFPHIGGLQLSEDVNDDHYLFPLWGGVIAAQNGNYRSFYGDDTAWWQMATLFSPAGGGGLSLRSLDESGMFKGVALRKGATPAPGSTFLRGVNYAGMNLDQAWKDTLKSGEGTSVALEYLKYTRESGKSFSAPDAALEMFSGDWHAAMREYSRWAHRTWKWRPWPAAIRDYWNIDSPGWAQKPLFKDGQWRDDYINEKSDISEIMSWWQWSKKGPWQVPMDQIKEKLGETIYNAYSGYWVVNDATGNVEYPLNRGDYYYNEDWGGLPALRKQLQKIRDGSQMPWFYTDPFLADDNTELGHKYGPQYGVVKPDWNDYLKVPLSPPGYVTDYASWNMCLDTAWYQDFVVRQTERIARDTGVDGIRFDQMGLNGYACSNPRHKHVFAEPGHAANLQASTLICREVQAAINKFDPDFVLTTEFLGYDRLAATLEGSVNYESARHVFPDFRPVPLNIFRFYFPEHKHYDLDDLSTPGGQEWRFWNATGAFNILYPANRFAILKENSDTFDTRDAMPLVPTLKSGVYANRFSGGGKTIWMLYNASGFTVDAPLLSAPAKAGFHYFDLLNGKEITPQNGAVKMKLRPAQVACIALLPGVLQMQKTQNGRHVKLAGKVSNARVAVCDADGKELQSRPLVGPGVLLNAPDAAQLKLFSGKYLVDVVELKKQRES